MKAEEKKAIGAAYCSKELSQLLDKAGIKAHYVIQYEKGGSWYRKYTLDIACRWLREVHNLCIEPYRTASGYLYTISKIWTGSELYSAEYEGDDEASGQYTTYEKAVEAAIRYCIENLIKH